MEFDHEKIPASLSQQEESREALRMGLRRNFSKDDPESKTHNAARKTKQSRRGTSTLEVRGTPTETATENRSRKTEHSHSPTRANEQVGTETALRDKRFLRACNLKKNVNLHTRQ